MSIIYRPVGEEDYEDLSVLLQQLWPNIEISANDISTLITRGVNSNLQKYLVAVIDNIVVGFCTLTMKNSLWVKGNLGHIDELVVHEKHRNKGIGKALLERMTKIALNMGCLCLELDSAHDSSNTNNFYEEMGFVERGSILSKSLTNE